MAGLMSFGRCFSTAVVPASSCRALATRTAALRTSPFGLEKFALRKPIVASTEKPGSPSLTTPNFGMICSIN